MHLDKSFVINSKYNLNINSRLQFCKKTVCKILAWHALIKLEKKYLFTFR